MIKWVVRKIMHNIYCISAVERKILERGGGDQEKVMIEPTQIMCVPTTHQCLYKFCCHIGVYEFDTLVWCIS
jgi:hypothetical protein